MHDVLNGKALNLPFNLRLNDRPSRRGGLKFEILRVKYMYKVGKESAKYLWSGILLIEFGKF